MTLTLTQRLTPDRAERQYTVQARGMDVEEPRIGETLSQTQVQRLTARGYTIYVARS